jgi:hypothetical protein
MVAMVSTMMVTIVITAETSQGRWKGDNVCGNE